MRMTKLLFLQFLIRRNLTTRRKRSPATNERKQAITQMNVTRKKLCRYQPIRKDGVS